MPLALSCPLLPRCGSYCLTPSCTCRCLPALPNSPRLWAEPSAVCTGGWFVAFELSRCDLTREYVCLLCLYPHGWWLMHAVHSLGSQNMLYNHKALSLHIPLASAPLVENRPPSDSHKFSSPAPEASQADRRAKHNAAGSENMLLLWFRTWTSSTSRFMWAERRAEYVSFITYSCSFFCLTLPGF